MDATQKFDTAASEIDRIRQEAERGNAKAQFELGLNYQIGMCGLDDKKSARNAVKWYRKAAEQGYARAQYELGRCYCYGAGVPQDLEKVFYWYEKAAYQGYTKAQYDLGWCYQTGWGVTQNLVTAVYWLKKAAEQGYELAIIRLGNCYAHGKGVEKDLAKAIEWYEKAAERGWAEAQIELGNCYYSGNGVVQDFETAAYWYGKAAEHGDAGAKSKLNLCMEHIWEEAERDVASAQDFLGSCYEEGNGVKKDRRMAIFWYWNAARNASGGGKYHLSRLTDGTDVAAAVLYANKHGAVVKTAAGQYALGTVFARQKRISVQREAIKLFQSAAAQGNAEAQLELARRHTNGDGIQKDQSAAAYWYLRAAEQDNATAQNIIGVCYELGQGVISNRELAAFWYWNAARNGDSYGKENLSRLEQQGVDTARALLNAHLHQAAVKTAAGQYALGAAFAGQDSKTMRQEAMKLFLSAAKQGYGKAQLELGRRYACGEGVEKDQSAAAYWYQRAAEQGHAEAQFELGRCFACGEGVSKDQSAAVKWYEKAAEQGNAKAQFELGVCYEYGNGVQKDYDKAVYWYEKAAEKGNVTAQFKLGVCYENGKGVPKDYEKAVYWYQKAAEQGNATAQNTLGACYYNSIGAEDPVLFFGRHKGKRVSQAAAEMTAEECRKQAGFFNCNVDRYPLNQVFVDAFERMAKEKEGDSTENSSVETKSPVAAGFGSAMSGVTLYEQIHKNLEKAVYCYQKAAEQGKARAQYELGVCYENSKGVPKDYEKAVYWYQKAAEQGNAEAQFELGVCYEYGNGVQKDAEKAVYWYQKAAEQGNAEAQFELGVCYYNGEGVPKDYDKAAYWYQRAAKQGNATAQYKLGVCYEYGNGVQKDAEKAVYWYETAAKKGNAAAQNNLGVRYENGEGVPKDYDKAVYWYEKAAKQGHASAQSRLDDIREKERQRLVAEEAEYKRILEKARQRCLDEQVPELAQTLLQNCIEKTPGILPPLPEILQDFEPDRLYQYARQAEEEENYPQAILLYGWAARKGSRSAGYNIVNMSVKSSLYFLDRPDASEAEKEWMK